VPISKVRASAKDAELLWVKVELDRYIGSTHNRGRLWDNRNNRQSMTIGDQTMPMFQDEDTYRRHEIYRPPLKHYSRFCAVSVFDETSCSSIRLPCWTNNHYPMPGLNVVINLFKLALLPTPLQKRHFSRQSVTLIIGLTIIGCYDNWDNQLSGQLGKCAIGQALSEGLGQDPGST